MNFSHQYYTHHPAADYFNGADLNEGVNNNVYDFGDAPFQGENGPIGDPGHIEQNEPGVNPGEGVDPSLGIQDIGMSVPMGISAQNVAGIYSKIRMGAGKLEIQFPGYRGGQRQSQTPGMLGEDQRQALREMQMANEVRLSSHSSFGIMGMLGRDERGNYSAVGAQSDMMEVRRAIDFQTDIGGGGSVVVHSGEFERPMTDMYLDDETHSLNLARDSSGRLLVRQNQTQEFDAKFDLMDSRTSQKMETVQKDRLVSYPVWLRAEKDSTYTATDDDPSGQQKGTVVHVKKGDYIDYQGRYIADPHHPLKGRVPIYNEKTGRFKTDMKHFDYFKKEAAEYNEYLRNKKGRELTYAEKIYPEEMFLRATLDTQEAHSRGWALSYGEKVQTWIDSLKAINKAIKFYDELDKNMPEDDKWKLMRREHVVPQGISGWDLIPSQQKSPLEVLQNARTEAEKQLEFARQASAAQETQAEDSHETKENLITPIKRLEQHGVRMYAEAALHAYQKTKDPNNPVTLAIENIFPERFGGHLEELKWIVNKTRERFAEFLTNPKIQLGVSRHPEEMDQDKLDEALLPGKTGMLQDNPYYAGISKEEAMELAKKHVKVTLDTGHMNMWRRYWQKDPQLTEEQNDQQFKKWYLEQVESLAKEGMVGNVHLADNYGYHDDHLAPGQGNAPVKEVVQILKKYGYDGNYTVEPGADASTDNSDFHGLMKTWRHFGSHVYGVGGGMSSVPTRWTDVQHSYFGQNNSPNYIFGNYAPSNEWTMWSQVPLE